MKFHELFLWGIRLRDGTFEQDLYYCCPKCAFSSFLWRSKCRICRAPLR